MKTVLEIGGILVGIAVLAVVVMSLPSLIRYIKISNM